MKKLFLFLLLLLAFEPIAKASNYSFFVSASSNNIPTAYAFGNSGSLVMTVPVAQRAPDQVECIVNGTTSYIAAALDWGDNKSNPSTGGTYTVTSPEMAIGPGVVLCTRFFGPYTFIRSLTGSAISSGYVYGYSRQEGL